jgi:hypothetical protein
MKYKYLILSLLLLSLTGCGNKEEEATNSSITLAPPKIEEVIVHSDNPQPMQVEKPEVQELEIKSRTKIMVSADNVDSFNKKEAEPIDMTQVIEDTPILSRFKSNISNIKFPKNYRVTGTATDGEKNTTLSISKMHSGELYTSINYEDILLEKFTPNDNTEVKEVYIISNKDGEVIEGKALSYSAVDTVSYSDFELLSISDATEYGNNYKLEATFIVDGQQTTGTLSISESMTVHSIKYNYNGMDYDLKVQTLLKLPKTINEFQKNDVTIEQMDLYTNYLHNAFVTKNNELTKTSNETTTPIISSIPQGYIDKKEDVDVELDDKGNIVTITSTKEYIYPNGDTVKEITVKDKDGNIIDTKTESKIVDNQIIPEQDTTNNIDEDTKEEESSSIPDNSKECILKPIIKIDENIIASELEDKLIAELTKLDPALGVNYKVVQPEDPTTITMDISYIGESNKAVLEKFLNKFADDNYTIILGWR